MKFEKWLIKGYERSQAAKMCREGINPLIALSLASKGIVTADEARDFMRDDIGLLGDPMMMKDMAPAVARLKKAIEIKEHIAVFGDYDVDGMTSSCLVADYFRRLGLTCEIYIPGRLEEGYGVNRIALDELHEKGVTLIVTVDCGITAVDEVKYASDLGMEMVITDHHECKETLPDAVAVINPKRPDCDYPYKTLAGVGVAFKLICAVDGSKDVVPLLDRYADLVAIGTVADVMSMRGENRALVRYGLNILNTRPRPGLKRLMEQACIADKEIKSATIGFTVAPRLNAAGRMSRTSLTVELLLTHDEAEADRLSQELNVLNTERRRIETQILDEALEILGDRPIHGPIVLAKEGWFQGVLGIVATRLAEKFYVPVILISTDRGEGRGSCRSFGG
ncbi:MAG: single-stranded-DNA-specific exonuclease RecJ, partial [Oscillospiraceae bacterium]|nr:single-stranded-DNA-specific exonuclease RecJ [Oscillospiraceae bacterium]